ncbi:MAG: hypothetical protein ACREQI_13420 [Candidatus Binataceae bacterium]
MPRRKAIGSAGSAFMQVQRQARALLGSLQQEIRSKELELNQLKEEESRLGALVGRVGGPSVRRGAGGGGRIGSGRINWRDILSQVPRQFKAADVRSIRGLRQKRPSEIFAAITRWIDSGLAKRKSRGMYEKS